MRGGKPKPPGMTQRRNKETSKSTFVDNNPIVDIPSLPKRGHKKWKAMTISWWNDVWTSPMASEDLTADKHGLYVLAELIDQYWRDPKPSTAAEIRLQRQCFGLTPIDRRRLQWEIQRGEEAEGKRKPEKPKLAPNADDPRAALKAVK